MKTYSTLPSRHKHKDEILYYQNLIGFSDEIVNKLYTMTKGLTNRKLYTYIDNFLRNSKGEVPDYYFKKEYVTVVTCAIYKINLEIAADIDDKFTVKHLLDDIIFVKNSNRSLYAKMLASIDLQDPKYSFTHLARQGDPSPKVHKKAKEHKNKIKTNTLYRFFNGGGEDNGTTISK